MGRRILPGQCYPFWENHCKGSVRAPHRDVVASDAAMTDDGAAPLPRSARSFRPWGYCEPRLPVPSKSPASSKRPPKVSLAEVY